MRSGVSSAAVSLYVNVQAASTAVVELSVVTLKSSIVCARYTRRTKASTALARTDASSSVKSADERSTPAESEGWYASSLMSFVSLTLLRRFFRRDSNGSTSSTSSIIRACSSKAA